ncbi:hypothetical protein ACWOBX_08400 [Facklamia languida]
MAEMIKESMMNLDSSAVAGLIIVAVVIAILTELIKAFDRNNKLSAQLIQGISLLVGITIANVLAVLIGQDWTLYTLIGMAGAVMSSGIYEWASKTFSILKGE